MSLLNLFGASGRRASYEDSFKVVTYIGTGTEQSITGLGFKPDLVWIKAMDSATFHVLTDIVRGVTERVRSDDPAAEVTDTNGLSSFDSDGFTIISDTAYNQVSIKYVAWCWKGSNTTETLSGTGTIDSVVSANPEAGFSIVKYSGNSTAGATVEHGLGIIPELILVKSRTGATNWAVYSDIAGNTERMYLNENYDSDPTTIWDSTTPTSLVFSLGNDNNVNTGQDYIAYCFASVTGFVKHYVYTGDGLTDGPTITCGFQPSAVMIKGYDQNCSWHMYNNARSPSNPMNEYVVADTVAVEGTSGRDISFSSTGFKIETPIGEINASGVNFTYIAFAEQPEEYSSHSKSYPLFNQIGFTGNATAGRIIDGFGFKPDFVWIKDRDTAYDHMWFDAMRGPGYEINSNTTTESTWDADTLLSFQSDGVVLGADVKTNASNDLMIAYGWNAGGELEYHDGVASSSEPSEVMANQDAGFSVTSFVGTGSDMTVEHGLGVIPEFCIVKRQDGGAGDFMFYSSEMTSAGYWMRMNDDNAEAGPDATFYQSTAPTDTVFYIGTNANVNINGTKFLLYSWVSKSGYSKIDSYEGNGTSYSVTDVGFEPDFVLIKSVDTVASWGMFDKDRSAANVLHPDTNAVNASDTDTLTSFDSGGFTVGADIKVNAASTYLYMAFKVTDNPDTLHQVETGDLLLSMDGDYLDENSTHTFTSGGDVSIVSTPSSPTDTAAESALFTTSATSYLAAVDHADWDLGTADFTIDWWQYPTASGGMIFCQGADASNRHYLQMDSTTIRYYAAVGGVLLSADFTTDSNLNKWLHIALVRSDGLFKCYRNGQQQGSDEAYTGDMSGLTTDMNIGIYYTLAANSYAGNIDHFRWTKGTALWTTTNFNLTDKGLKYPSGTLNI